VRATPRRSGAGQAGCQVSIFEETGGTLAGVAHDRSLELFFDRYEAIARFVSLINEDPAPRRLSYLYGLGGNGKSLLLRYLAARCCVRLPPDEWKRLRQPPDWSRRAGREAKRRWCRGGRLGVRRGRSRGKAFRRCSCSSSAGPVALIGTPSSPPGGDLPAQASVGLTDVASRSRGGTGGRAGTRDARRRRSDAVGQSLFGAVNRRWTIALRSPPSAARRGHAVR
jgi:hypothetical protein